MPGNTNKNCIRYAKKKNHFGVHKKSTPQLNGVIERRFVVIKKVSLAMLLNAKLNKRYKKILWAEAVHMCERVYTST